jgi:hypothetical protein
MEEIGSLAELIFSVVKSELVCEDDDISGFMYEIVVVSRFLTDENISKLESRSFGTVVDSCDVDARFMFVDLNLSEVDICAVGVKDAVVRRIDGLVSDEV